MNALRIERKIFFSFRKRSRFDFLFVWACCHLKVGIRSERMVRQTSLSQRKISIMGLPRNVFGLGPYIFFVRFVKRSPHLKVVTRSHKKEIETWTLSERKKDLVLDLVRIVARFFCFAFFIFLALFSDVTFVRNMNGSCYGWCHFNLHNKWIEIIII